MPSRQLPVRAPSCRAVVAAVLACLATWVAIPATAGAATAGTATASSQYPLYEAPKAIDGVTADNDLWQSVVGEAAPWWQVETPDPVQATGLGISFAGYQGKYYSVPQEIDVSVGDPGHLTHVLTIPASAMPSTGAAYSPKIVFFAFPQTATGTVVRLDFPQGGQAGGSGNVALGEVQVLTPDDQPNLALGRPASASSAQVYNDAGKLVNGTIGQYPDMWQTQVTPTPQPASVPTYWGVDLGAVDSLGSISIGYGGYQGKYYGVPETTVVQVKDHLCDDWVDVARIGAADSPTTGDPFEARYFDYALPAGTKGRYLRLLFPDGNKQPGPPGLPPNGAALSEVQVHGMPGTPEQDPTRTATLSSGFGDVTVDLTHPGMTSLKLYDYDGQPSGKSLLADGSGPNAGAYTYLSTSGGRFSSEGSCGQQASVSQDEISIHGIVPRSAGGDPGPVVEDWKLTTAPDSRTLTWTITQRWQRDTTVQLSGTPALFLGPFGFFGRQPAATDTARVTSTFWYDPALVQADGPETCPGYYAPWFGEGTSTRNVCQIITEPNTWATLKLFTNTHEGSDLGMEVSGSGHLYRRGHSIAAFNEVGSVASPTLGFQRKAGDVDVTTLTLTPKDKTESGYQLHVSIPDKDMEHSLRDLYGSTLNGGTVTDQKTYDLGNESEGVNYSGSAWMQGRALSAGVPGDDPLSAHPFTFDRAFRDHLQHILDTVDEDGLTSFGFYAAGNRAAATDQNLQTILGVHDYVVNSGDVDFARQALPAVRRMLRFHLDRIQPNGLYEAPVAAPAWYYDAVKFSGYNTYYQAFLYKALRDAAELERAAGDPTKAVADDTAAANLADAINTVLWMPDAPGGARYMDWLDENGNPATYFIDIVQYPLIAFGIAPPDRARQVLATADARMQQLTDSNGYTRQASLSSLWPQPPSVDVFGFPFGTYMNGGSLLAQTYWEVVARAKMGDVDGTWGAARLLKRFAQRFQETSWVGDNAADIHGDMRNGDQEPYLADMMVTPASLVDGILGVDASWDGLTVQPHLPAGWDQASARVRYKGHVYSIHIHDGQVAVTPPVPPAGG